MHLFHGSLAGQYVDEDNGDQNITKPLSKDRSLIWIGSYAINSERVAIFILFAGLLFLLALILQSWRKDVINKRKYKQYRKAQQDLPPTYTELVLNKNPPAYKESLMQVLIIAKKCLTTILIRKISFMKLL